MRIGSPVAGALLLAAVLAPAPARAYPRDDAAVVEVAIYSRADIERLNELGMDIMSVADGVAEIAAIPGEIDVLSANGFDPAVVVANMRDAVWSLGIPGRGEYHDYTEVTADLAAWHAAYPSITELVSIGQSVQGRELWALKITDNPGVQEDEAEIVWVGGHHGDETIGVEVVYYTAKYLLENYGTNTQVTWLVNNREFWAIPMFNPDGYTAGSRYNAQGVDLNRDYYCPDGSNAGSCWSAPETRALRDFCAGMNPATSLQFHAGAIYVNYLWDYTYDPTPDEPMIITLSNGYGSRSGYPVINGADWYIVEGSCQDWCYHARGEIATTIEVSNSKNPSASSIDGIVNQNRSAMLYQARKAGKGVQGTVTDAETGDPLFATISIPQIGKDVFTDPDAGDYHRMLQTGTYTVTASAAEYETQSVTGVSANLDTMVVVNFALAPPERGTIAGYVMGGDMNPLAATVELTDLTGYSTVADAGTGYYEILHVPVGSHDVKASKTGYRTTLHEGVVVQYQTTTSESFTLASPLLYDDFEGGMSLWTGGWSATTSQSHTPTRSATDSPSGNYGNNVLTVMTLASPIDLSSAGTALLAFWHRYDTEAGYDFCSVQVSTNGGSSWTQVASWSGSMPAWTECQVDLTSFVGTADFKVRFILDSDYYVTRDGWYVDDVQIYGDEPESGVPDGGFGAPELAVSNYPNPFNPTTTIRFEVPADGPVDLAVYSASGRVVRTLLAGEDRSVGRHEVDWNGTDDRGIPVASGVYFVRATVPGHDVTRKMILLK